jgi:hypothetical protein
VNSAAPANNLFTIHRLQFTKGYALCAWRLASHKVADKDPPKFSGALEYWHRFIVPPKVLTALTAEGHAPAVTRKPGVGCCGTSMGDCTRTIWKGTKITFYTRWIDKEMSVGSAYNKQSIRIGDKASAAKALVDFGTIATDSFQGKSEAEHCGFQIEEGLLAGKIANSPEKSIFMVSRHQFRKHPG